MISRIAIKTGDINITDGTLCVGKDGFLEIPVPSIQWMKYYDPTETEAGYLAIVKNDFKDADIIFFHKDFKDHFKTIEQSFIEMSNPK